MSGRIMIAAGVLCMAAGMAQAEKVALATFLEPNHVITRTLHQAWAEDLRAASNGEIDFEVFVGGTLMPPLSQLRGVADGVAQAGIHGAPYTPAELPVANALADLGFLSSDEFVLAYAYADFMTHEPVGIAEWERNGVIYGAGFANPTYYYLCNDDLSTAADMKGKRVRTSGAGWARFSQSIGMVPVNLPSSEIYTGLERGALDCANADVTHLVNGATIIDLTESVVMLPTAPAFASPGIVYNHPWWQSLTPEQRRIVFDTTARAMARVQIEFALQVAASIEAGKAKGIKFNDPEPSLLAARDQWVADGIGDLAGLARNTYGIEDPEALFALFQTYIDKWSGLMAGVDRTDEDALTALVKTNLFDTIDVETYGVN